MTYSAVAQGFGDVQRSLGCLQNGSLDRLGHLDRNEPAGRVQVVLAAFVNDSDLAVLFRFRVRPHDIDLVAFQRRFVALVPYAYARIVWTTSFSQASLVQVPLV